MPLGRRTTLTMQLIEINSNNIEQGINAIRAAVLRCGNLKIMYDDNSEDGIAEKTLESFNKIKQLNKGFKIPEGVDIDKLANESNL